MPSTDRRLTLSRGIRLALAALALAAAVPVATAPVVRAQPTRAATTYVVRAGDTLSSISRATGVSVSELRRLNGIEGDIIQVGQTLRLSALVPAPPRPPTGTDGTPTALPPAPGPARGTHVVQSGETLFSISRRYGTTTEVLRQLNGIVGDRVEVGRRLTVPMAPGAAATPVAPPPPAPPVPDPTVPDRPAVAAPVTPTGAVAPAFVLGPWRIDRTTIPADLVHFVDPGETLFSIAVRYGFSTDDLVAVNELTTAPLEPGTVLALPAPVDPSVPHEVALPSVDATGLALVYTDEMAGRTTASGERYDAAALTAAHRTLPFGTVLLVTNPATGRTVFVRVNDRGPASAAYLIELSGAAAAALELDPNAARRVEVRRVP